MNNEHCSYYYYYYYYYYYNYYYYSYYTGGPLPASLGRGQSQPRSTGGGRGGAGHTPQVLLSSPPPYLLLLRLLALHSKLLAPLLAGDQEEACLLLPFPPATLSLFLQLLETGQAASNSLRNLEEVSVPSLRINTLSHEPNHLYHS